jgi:hypothetical protein
MRNVSDKRGGDNENKHPRFNNFSQKNLAVYEIKCKNILETDRSQRVI